MDDRYHFSKINDVHITVNYFKEVFVTESFLSSSRKLLHLFTIHVIRLDKKMIITDLIISKKTSLIYLGTTYLNFFILTQVFYFAQGGLILDLLNGSTCCYLLSRRMMESKASRVWQSCKKASEIESCCLGGKTQCACKRQDHAYSALNLFHFSMPERCY